VDGLGLVVIAMNRSKRESILALREEWMESIFVFKAEWFWVKRFTASSNLSMVAWQVLCSGMVGRSDQLIG